MSRVFSGSITSSGSATARMKGSAGSEMPAPSTSTAGFKRAFATIAVSSCPQTTTSASAMRSGVGMAGTCRTRPGRPFRRDAASGWANAPSDTTRTVSRRRVGASAMGTNRAGSGSDQPPPASKRHKGTPSGVATLPRARTAATSPGAVDAGRSVQSRSGRTVRSSDKTPCPALGER